MNKNTFARHLLSLTLLFTMLPALPQRGYAQTGATRTQAAAPASDLQARLAAIEEKTEKRRKELGIPGMSLAIVKDGEVIYMKGLGYKDFEKQIAVTPDTQFAIGSASKAFTALSALMSVDEGKLSLDDPAAKYIPALADLPYPTKDSPAITIRHLLTHSEGFPEDNPWGDRQLHQTDETMRAWIRAGIPFSTVPGMEFEYSNYGFAILGAVIARASGKPYADYVRDNILRPLGMNAATFESTEVSKDQIALGYRWDGQAYQPEPILAHGSFGGMGGLWTSARDLARYVAFLMSAFPPRDEAERGPIKRSSAREMQQVGRAQPAIAYRSAVDGPLQLGSGGYAYGLGVSQDCRFNYIVGHSGGLPGYGSLMRWLPEYGVGMIAMGNRTYSGFGGVFNEAVNALYKTGALKPRVVQPSAALLTAQADVSQLIIKWDDALANRIAADNLFLDTPLETRKTRWQAAFKDHGTCRPATSIEPENALRGTWKMMCDRGWLEVGITLAPTMPPKVQLINISPVMPPDAATLDMIKTVGKLLASWDGDMAKMITAPSFDLQRMQKQFAAAAAWGSCSVGETLSGNGTRSVTVRLVCEKAPMAMRVAIEPGTRKFTDVTLIPLREQRCVP